MTPAERIHKRGWPCEVNEAHVSSSIDLEPSEVPNTLGLSEYGSVGIVLDWTSRLVLEDVGTDPAWVLEAHQVAHAAVMVSMFCVLKLWRL